MSPQLKSTLFSVMFLVGLFLIVTADLRITAGALFMTIGYNEFRNSGLTKKISDELLDLINKDKDSD